MFKEGFTRGTTSVVAADANGWLVAVTPSGGWIPAVIAGRTGIGVSQRMQSFVLDAGREPVQRRRARQASARHADAEPRAARTASRGSRSPCRAAIRRTRTCCSSFSTSLEFGMTPQEAVEAANFNSYQMKSSFDEHESEPGRLMLNTATPPWVTRELRERGYTLEFEARTLRARSTRS